MQAPTNGFFYVLDRETGKLISAEKIGKVTWAERIDLKTGRPVEDARTSATRTGETTCAGHARRPQLAGDVVQPADRAWSTSRSSRQRPLSRAAWPSLTDEPLGSPRAGARSMPTVKRPATARARWSPGIRSPRKSAGRSSTTDLWNGGTLATAGDLVFQGTADGYFTAYDAADRQAAVVGLAGLGIIAAPISYSRSTASKYVSVLVGWGGAFARRARAPGKLLTFALDGTAALPPRPAPRPVTAIANPARPDEIAAGAKLFTTYCARCHGGSTVLPDLRRSSPGVYQSYERILLEGALAERGMPLFDYLDCPAVAALRVYLLDERAKLVAQP